MKYHQVKLGEILSSENLFTLLSRAQQTLEGFRIVLDSPGNSGEFNAKGSLHKFPLPHGIHLTKVTYIEGVFKSKNDPVAEIARMMGRATPVLNELGHFSAECQFKASGFEDIKRPEKCGILFWRGKLFIKYESAIEQASARKDVFKNLIVSTGLPIRITEDQRGFYLQHTQGGLLRSLSGGVYSENPQSFWCELSGTDASTLVPYVSATINGFSATVASLSWTIVPGQERVLGMDAIKALEFPCDKFGINCGFTFDRLEVLEELVSVKISSGYFASTIAAFKLNGMLSELQVRTNPKGHRLYAEIPAGSFPKLNEALGINLVVDE